MHFLGLMNFSLTNVDAAGEIPQELGNLAELMILSVVENELSGAIPKEVGNMTKLKELYLDGNKLQGEIPYEISTLPIIEFLTLGSNYLGGIVPPWIFNISTLKLLDLTYDKPSHRHGQLSGKFSGILPVSIGVGLPNLEELYLGNNSFSGIIPRSITNITKLSVLELSSNSFTGSIPSTIGSLRNLTWLNLSDNDLTSAPDLSFLLSLTSCKTLKNLFLSENRLTGILPSFIGNFSITLEVFDVEGCYFKGRIPKQISNLKSLTTINLGSNELTGSIPDTFGQLHNLQGLYLYNNKLEGFVPKSLCRLHRLAYLDMKSNKLSGSIPSCLSSLTSLREIDLSNNGFSSTIPTTLWNLKYVLHLNVSSNSLIGHVSLEIGNLNVVLSIDLSRNHLSGSIPTTIGGLRDLQHLSLGSNRLEGSIPKSIGEIVALESLDLSSNNIFGIIPKSLEALHLKYLNLSFNRLEGEIPAGGYFANFSAESFMGNPALCGPLPRGIPSCHRKGHKKSRIVIVILSITLPLVFVLAFTLVLIKFRQKRIRKLPNDTESSSSIGTWRRISYWEVLQSTDGFDECNMLGSGSLGSVYKGRLPDGLEIAVKVFNLELEEAVKSFDVECEVLSKIRHRNLVQVISSGSNEDFKALILKYMPNGSLEKCLYSHNYFLNIFQRLNIMIDVASALEYLRFENSTLIVHCDLKPSNVLIDENMVGHLSDFGIAKLLGEESMQQTQILATIGYMAPEYGREGQVSRKCDVYSFGIMLMETFTRKKPTDKCFDGEISLKSWVYNSLHSAVTKIVDANLLKEEDEHFAAKEDIVSSILSLAIDCTEMLPEKRVDTRYVVNRLITIRAKLLDEVGRGQCSKETI